jgi:hypothetical protein
MRRIADLPTVCAIQDEHRSSDAKEKNHRNATTTPLRAALGAVMLATTDPAPLH